jgi:hypothetical protein
MLKFWYDKWCLVLETLNNPFQMVDYGLACSGFALFGWVVSFGLDLFNQSTSFKFFQWELYHGGVGWELLFGLVQWMLWFGLVDKELLFGLVDKELLFGLLD